MAEDVAAVTGLPPEEAMSFLEMAGGNVEAAIALFFDMQGGGVGGSFITGGWPSVPPVGAQTPENFPAHSLLFGSAAAPASWLEQGLEFDTNFSSRCGLLQAKNGPCGALAVVNAEVVAHLDCPLPSTGAADDNALAAALGVIVWRCATAGRVVLASFVSDVGGECSQEEFVSDGPTDVANRLLPRMESWKARGGCCLLCYSCVLTRGLEALSADVAADNGATPLVSGPHALCGTELVNLMLCGVARANVSAYGADGRKVTWRSRARVGLLSRDEIESGVPLADELRSPAMPIWLLHGGDHFTICWLPKEPRERMRARVKAIFDELVGGGSEPNDAAATALSRAAEENRLAPTAPAGAFDLVFWNGLPPSRQLCWLRLRGGGDDPLAAAPPAPPMHQPSQWRLVVGELESVVQASPDDKAAKPGCWREHSYELSLVTPAVAKEDEATAPRPETEPPPVTFEPGAPPPAGQPWRCASCYNSRFQTMCFGENVRPATTTCKFCGRPQAEAGWTLWKKYTELPPPIQRRVDRANGPKCLAVLRTRWPEARVSAVRPDGREAELGSAAFDPAAYSVPSV